MKRGNNMKDTKETGADGPFDMLSDWEWTTLVGAWRYYEYRNTISSASFPAKIIERYWRSKMFINCARTRIAYQFAKVDHGAHGEEDWKGQPECDRIPWAKFYAFCSAWCDGFLKAVCTVGGKRRDVVCFECETTGRLYPVAEYIRNPKAECFLDREKVVETAKMNDALLSRRAALEAGGHGRSEAMCDDTKTLYWLQTTGCRPESAACG